MPQVTGRHAARRSASPGPLAAFSVVHSQTLCDVVHCGTTVSWRGARNKNRPSCPMACLLALGPFIATRVVDLTPFHAAAEVVDRRFADALSTSVSVRFNEAAGALQQWAVKASATDENGGEDEAFLAVVGLAVEVSALEINGIVRRELATP